MAAPIDRPVLAALILAAGYSSRMGRFKPLLPLDGETAIARVVAAFRQAGIGRIGAVVGHEAARLEPVLGGLEVLAVPNPAYSQGMYTSVQAGVAALAADVEACFLLPVDIPLVRPATVAALAGRFAAAPAAVLYPCFRGQRGHPPLIGRRLFAEILAGDGRGGLRAVLLRHESEAAELPVADEGILHDMDSTEEYLRLEEMARHRAVPSVAECEAIFETLGVAEPIRRHGRAVAAVARSLAAPLPGLDLDLVAAASLLHDIAKGQPAHAEAGAALVADLGFPAVAEAIGQHMDLRYDGGPPDAAAIVFLADKLVREDRRTTLEVRFQPAFERFADQPEALRGAIRKFQTARSLALALEAMAGTGLSRLLAGCGVPP